MPTPQDKRPSDGLSLPRLAVLMAPLAGLLFAIAMLALDVRSRLAELGSSDSDNGQWVVMRSEVEALRLSLALHSADTPADALTEVRRWYDVFYSRVRLLEESPLYKRLMSMPANRAELDVLSAFIDRWTPVFDGSEAALIAALPALEADLAPVMAATRRLSLEALRDFSSSADATRAAISETLLRLAITITATILLLAVLVAVLAALYRVAGRRAEESRLTGNRLQMIIETSPDAMIVTNRGGWVLEFNPVAERMFGIPRAQILGRNAVATIFPPGEAEEVQRVISEAIAETVDRGPQRIEIEGRRADGTRFPLELSIAISDVARGMIIVGFIRDISERRAAEEALREALSAARESERTRADFLAVMSHEMRTPLNGLIGATELMRIPMGELVGHAEIRIGDSVVMLADEMEGHAGPQTLGGTPVSLMIYTDDADATFARAVAAGATVKRPVENQFYGDRTGVLVDPYGHVWSIATHVEDVSAEEIARRLAAMG
jgi:PAS domain S-box-containing protein